MPQACRRRRTQIGRRRCLRANLCSVALVIAQHKHTDMYTAAPRLYLVLTPRDTVCILCRHMAAATSNGLGTCVLSGSPIGADRNETGVTLRPCRSLFPPYSYYTYRCAYRTRWEHDLPPRTHPQLPGKCFVR